MRCVLAVVLQIPPVGSAAHLRTAFLLRMTGDVFTSIPGYPAGSEDVPHLIDWLDDLDQAWVAVLRSQVWDPASQEAIDLPVDTGMNTSSLAVSQTDRTRLRSLLVGGLGVLEEWYGTANADKGNLEEAFGGLKVQDGLDDLFSRTLEEIGGFGDVTEGLVMDDEVS